MSLLSTGPPDQVKGYCKIPIDFAGKDGGFIMSSAANFDDAKIKNARALVDFTRMYGVYWFQDRAPEIQSVAAGAVQAALGPS